MLKKLAKYGNSTTLVIDKAILELLNMDESSIVKLHTDGKSLIVTPVEKIDASQKISYDMYEALNSAKHSMEKKLINKAVDQKTMEKMQAGFQEVFQKHQQAFLKFNTEILCSEGFQTALAHLVETIDPVGKSKEFIQSFNALRIQFCPELNELQKDIDALQKKYNHELQHINPE